MRCEYVMLKWKLRGYFIIWPVEFRIYTLLMYVCLLWPPPPPPLKHLIIKGLQKCVSTHDQKEKNINIAITGWYPFVTRERCCEVERNDEQKYPTQLYNCRTSCGLRHLPSFLPPSLSLYPWVLAVAACMSTYNLFTCVRLTGTESSYYYIEIAVCGANT